MSNTSPDTSDVPPELQHLSPTFRVLPIVLFNFLVYFVIGLPNAVIGALFVQNSLGFMGFATTTITLQYLGTFLTRLIAGQLVDKHGPKKILTYGLIACTVSGLLMCLAAVFAGSFGVTGTARYAALAIALFSRLMIGWAESWTATSVTAWNMRRVGRTHTSVAISWNGVTTYCGIGVGVIVGKFLAGLMPGSTGAHISPLVLLPVGILAAAIGILGLGLLTTHKAIPPLPKGGKTMPFFSAVRKVLPYGAGLAAGSCGFGTVNGCLSLYFLQNNWSGLGIAWGLFSIIFIAVRMIFSSQIDKRGGVLVGAISLLLEALAMVVFYLSYTTQSAHLAIAATALTGAGFSLLFPALGTVATKTAGPEFGGILIAAYSIFTDLTIFLVGPFVGFLQSEHCSWSTIFAIVGILCFAGIILTQLLSRIPGCGIQKNTTSS